MKIRILFTAFLICAFLSCNKTHIENYEDLQKLESGMELDEVLSLMRNEPVLIEKAYWDENLFIYSFESPPAASDYYKVIFRKNDSVVTEILYGD
ncbi:hypothetical protein LDL76_15565 [Salegentibacter mishustinae]|jgi:hypothetical protein|uniref:hypothetical protein n=1 Tax=Salegentibacter mishustinae TaxID=270918 RepID=UPI001CE11E23|nr:hypothetical protein [Salegentibacter mishustinae]UBZ06762.1 hypothetical protein LDL76_15565 [Salegentibacter mishustinae]|tara:strand:+ start:168 stop:452 length:285 start_codon:yes stop_codon:yes gene_type:complete